MRRTQILEKLSYRGLLLLQLNILLKGHKLTLMKTILTYSTIWKRTTALTSLDLLFINYTAVTYNQCKGEGGDSGETLVTSANESGINGEQGHQEVHDLIQHSSKFSKCQLQTLGNSLFLREQELQLGSQVWAFTLGKLSSRSAARVLSTSWRTLMKSSTCEPHKEPSNCSEGTGSFKDIRRDYENAPPET